MPFPRRPTASEWQTLVGYFPNLNQGNVWVTAPESTIYNCIAWSLGFSDRWINPNSPLSAFQAQYQSYGYQTLPALAADATIDGFGLSGGRNMTHGDKTYTGASVGQSGLWESKLGSYLRITHGRRGLEDNTYGRILTSFKPVQSVSQGDVHQMDITPEHSSAIDGAVADVDEEVRHEFEHLFAAWQDSWSEGRTAVSSDTADFAAGEEYEALRGMGPAILPLVVDKLRNTENFPALVLYEALQDDDRLILAASSPFEGEQARARRIVAAWAAHRQG